MTYTFCSYSQLVSSWKMQQDSLPHVLRRGSHSTVSSLVPVGIAEPGELDCVEAARHSTVQLPSASNAVPRQEFPDNTNSEMGEVTVD